MGLWWCHWGGIFLLTGVLTRTFQSSWWLAVHWLFHRRLLHTFIWLKWSCMFTFQVTHFSAIDCSSTYAWFIVVIIWLTIEGFILVIRIISCNPAKHCHLVGAWCWYLLLCSRRSIISLLDHFCSDRDWRCCCPVFYWCSQALVSK